MSKTIDLKSYCDIGGYDNSVQMFLWSDRDKNVYLADKNKVYSFDGTAFKSIYESKEKFWINNLNRDPSNISFRRKTRDFVYFKRPKSNAVQGIYEKNISHYMWEDGKILVKSFIEFENDEKLGEEKVIGYNMISHLGDTLSSKSQKSYVFEVVDDDLFYMDKDSLKLYNFNTQKIQNISSANYPVFSNLNILHMRRNGNTIWAGSNEGLIKIKKEKNIFQSILDTDHLSTREMLVISEDSLLVNSERGTYLLDLKHNTVIERFNETKQYYGMTQIDSFKYLLGSFSESKLVLDIKNKNSKLIAFENTISKINDQVYDVFLNSYVDNRNQLWITSINGVAICDKQNFKLDYLFQSDLTGVSVTDIIGFPDRDSILLLSDKGLYEVNINDYSIHKFNALENKVISHVVEDSQDNSIFWVATRYEGLIKWKYHGRIQEMINSEKGLSHNNVHSVFEDKHDRLWLSTDYGISIYNKLSGEISVIYEENGIHENEMNRHSYCFVNDSLIVYGGINGLIIFNPYDVQLDINSKELEIKSLSYLDAENNTREVVALNQDINKIRLTRNQKEAKVIFDIPENSFSNTLRYIYSSNNSKWKYTQGNFIDISNLEEETTNIFVSKKIGINEWSSPKTFQIFKVPPFYRSYWFYGLMISLVSLSIFVYINNRRVRALKLNKRIQKEVDTKTKELYYKNKSLSESKKLNDQFFTIISHDLRSPLISLNNISKSIHYLTENKEYDNVKKLTQSIESNSKRSLAIIDRLLEWTEKQKASMLEFQEVNIAECIAKSIYEKEDFAKERQISIVKTGSEKIKCISNESSLLIVLGNVLSNAIKFSYPDDEVHIKYYTKATNIIIEVSDHGIGMNEDQLIKINSSKSVIPFASPSGEIGLGMGILLSREILLKVKGEIRYESNLGEGTTAIIKLPY